MKIFISAGEPSGDLYGSILANELKRQVPSIEISGIGGPLMAQAGVRLVKSIEELSIFGFYEGIKAYPKMRKVLKEIIFYLKNNPPDILLPIAFSNFNLLLLKNLTSYSFNHLTIYYFAPPQLWAWGRWRNYFLKRYVDRVICLFPFEEGFFNNLGIDAVYLGNPLLDYVRSSQSKHEFAQAFGLKPTDFVISFMAGSRKEEFGYHFPLLLQIFSTLTREFPHLYGFVILYEDLKNQILPQINRLFYSRNQKYDIMRNSDLILLTSGTAALEAMILETPAVSIYTLSPFSYLIARFTVKLNNFSIPNLIANKEILPELLQPDFNSLYPLTSNLIKDRIKREEVKTGLIKTKSLLGPSGAQERIVQFILSECNL